jgi:crossover junction endodeoxyribonuclease RuvC
MIILSIDPGFERVGIAVIEKNKGNKEVLVYSECFKTSATLTFPERLVLIEEEIERICKDFAPEHLAIETLFMTTNQKTVINVAQARGVLLSTAKRNGLDVYEYTPLQVKVAVTGYGKSDKKAIMYMVPKIINIEIEKKSDDELDAIAIGLTHVAHLHL